MKLQVSFDLTDLTTSLEVAKKVVDYADILEIGTILLHRYGFEAIDRFCQAFPDKTILVDTKIIDRGTDIISLLGKTKVDWITVMAGTSKAVIHAACKVAHDNDKKVMLDLLDARSIGQSALEADNLGADALLFHQPYDAEESLIFLDKWEMIRGNTSLPIFVSAKISRETIDSIINVNPDGIIIGKSITEADDPAKEAKFFHDLCSKQS